MGLTKVGRLFEKLERKGMDVGIVSEGIDRWKDWMDAHELHQQNISPETFTWIREAFVDGYLRGVQKKITGD